MDTREAISMHGMPVGEHGEDGISYAVGQPYHRNIGGVWKIAGTVSRITVTEDLPGLYCNMERVRVFDGTTVVFEAPLHSLEGVAYAAAASGDAEGGAAHG